MPKNKVKVLGVPFEPVHSHRSFELVCEKVREKLLLGELKPGDKLPAERELSQQLNVSRNVVREALRSLENAGIVALKKGVKGGAFIQEGSTSSIAQGLSDLITLKAISLTDLFEARIMILEMVIDHVVVTNASPDLSGLEDVIAETRDAIEQNDTTRRIRCARDFYHELAALTHNSAIIFTVDSQTELVQVYLRYRVGEMDSDTLIRSREAFLHHMKAGDTDAAKSELREHMTRAHTNMW